MIIRDEELLCFALLDPPVSSRMRYVTCFNVNALVGGYMPKHLDINLYFTAHLKNNFSCFSSERNTRGDLCVVSEELFLVELFLLK